MAQMDDDDTSDERKFDAVSNVFEKARQRGGRTTLNNEEEANFADAIYKRRPEYKDKLDRYKRERAANSAADGVRRVRSGSAGSGA